MRVYFSLGSNVGDGTAQIRRALELLGRRGCRVLRISSLYRTEPVPPARDQPWFTNCVAEAETELSPRALLRTAKAIEGTMGRRRTAPGGPRPIDIDILFYEDETVCLPTLEIPHPRLSERRFVLIPLKELSPKLRHPVSKKTVSQILRETADRSRVRRIRQR
jgi:2-amino-4-hydroxy-6-hydroxymethyldihydropteridine diphosphokinase